MHDFAVEGKTVCGTRSIAEDIERAVRLSIVHTHHKHGSIVGRGRDDDLFCSILQLSSNLFQDTDYVRGLNNLFSIRTTPIDADRTLFLQGTNGWVFHWSPDSHSQF
jgi:hypothetical protein